MADEQTEETDDREWDIIRVNIYCGIFCFIIFSLNGTPLGFIDDVVKMICMGAIWPIFIFAICSDYYDQYQEEKNNSYLNSSNLIK